jgi:hypothetical protein
MSTLVRIRTWITMTSSYHNLGRYILSWALFTLPTEEKLILTLIAVSGKACFFLGLWSQAHPEMTASRKL